MLPHCELRVTELAHLKLAALRLRPVLERPMRLLVQRVGFQMNRDQQTLPQPPWKGLVAARVVQGIHPLLLAVPVPFPLRLMPLVRLPAEQLPRGGSNAGVRVL